MKATIKAGSIWLEGSNSERDMILEVGFAIATEIDARMIITEHGCHDGYDLCYLYTYPSKTYTVEEAREAYREAKESVKTLLAA